MTNTKKLSYIANVRLPTEKAHGVQIVKMCESLACLGYQVDLIVPFRIHSLYFNPDKLFRDYDVKTRFNLIRIINVDLLFLGKYVPFLLDLFFLIQNATYSISAYWFTKNGKQIVITRSVLFAALSNSPMLVLDSHQFPKDTWIARKAAKNAKKVFGVSKTIAEKWSALGADAEWLPNGIPDDFLVGSKKNVLRKKLGFDLKQKIILYTGSFYPWKGAQTLLQSAKKMHQYQFWFIGGAESDSDRDQLSYQARKFKHIHFLPHIKYSEIQLWQKVADLLVLPNLDTDAQSSMHTSPLKLYEYMASGNLVLASDVKAIRDMVSDDLVYFFKPGDSQNLEKQIRYIFSQNLDVEKKVKKAISFVKSKTLQVRAKRMIDAAEA